MVYYSSLAATSRKSHLHVCLASLVPAQFVVLLEDLAQAHRVYLSIAAAPLCSGHQIIHLQAGIYFQSVNLLLWHY